MPRQKRKEKKRRNFNCEIVEFVRFKSEVFPDIILKNKNKVKIKDGTTLFIYERQKSEERSKIARSVTTSFNKNRTP